MLNSWCTFAKRRRSVKLPFFPDSGACSLRFVCIQKWHLPTTVFRAIVFSTTTAVLSSCKWVAITHVDVQFAFLHEASGAFSLKSPGLSSWTALKKRFSVFSKRYFRIRWSEKVININLTYHFTLIIVFWLLILIIIKSVSYVIPLRLFYRIDKILEKYYAV